LTLQERFVEARRLVGAGDPDAAFEVCQSILAEWPGQSDTLHLLGLIALARGRTAEALGHMRHACAKVQAQASYFSNLAELCRQSGLYAEGEAAGRRAVALDADAAGPWNNLGIILQEAGKYTESKSCLARVLALTPEDPRAHNNFANTCKRLGELGLAERHWLRALALQEDYAEPHSNLATLLADRGAYGQAAAHARAAIALRPGFADAYLNLAMVEAARSDHAAALRVLEEVLVFAPDNATAMAAKALALLQFDRLEEALVWARRAASVGPENAEAMQALGQVCQAAGDVVGARGAFERAAALPGTVAEKALAGLAVLAMEQGDGGAAEAAFDAAVRAHPRSASLRYNRADLKRFNAGDADIDEMLAMLGPGGCESAHDRMLLRFALGTAYLQLGDGENAFLHLDEGNRMKRGTIDYDSAATLRWMEDIARHCDAAALARLGGEPMAAGDAAFAPVFVLGMPRSGTTLMEQILASHPAVHGAGELRLLANAIEAAGPYPATLQTLSAADVAGLAASYMTGLAQRSAARAPQTRYVIDKMPANFLYAGVVHAALPAARIVHCRRDPMDTCLSCYSKLFAREQLFTYDQAELGAFHRGYQAQMAHWRTVLPASRFLEVDYEDMVADLEGQARRLVDFLGLDWSVSCLEFYRTARPVRTASVNQVRRPIYGSSVGRWRQYAAHLAPLLAALGYGTPG
jgi:tetratricopeptide (TPR) repeat protein